MKKNIQKLLFICSVIGLSQCLFAETPPPEKDGYNPVNSLVIISNPNLLRHRYCIGVVLTSMMVAVPSECAQTGISTPIQIYEKPEDIQDEAVEGYSVKTPFAAPSGSVARLHLTKPLRNKEPAGFMLPELAAGQTYIFYYLAWQKSGLGINQRSVQMKQRASSYSSKFTVYVPEDWNQVIGDYLYGAILFDEDKQLIGVTYDEMSLYSMLGGDAVFRRVTLDDRWGAHGGDL